MPESRQLPGPEVARQIGVVARLRQVNGRIQRKGWFGEIPGPLSRGGVLDAIHRIGIIVQARQAVGEKVLVVSTTSTVKLHAAELPQASAAVHSTVVVPSGKRSPDRFEQVTAGVRPEPSVAVTTKLTGVPAVPALSTTRLGLQLMVRRAGSATVTRWLQNELLPQASVARQVRVTAKELAQTALVTVLTTVIVGEGSAASVADGASKVQPSPSLTTLSFAHTRAGGVVSTRVTTWLQALVLPQVSRASQVRRAL